MLLLASFLTVAFSRNIFSSINLNINSWIATIQNNSFTIVAEGIDIIFDTNSLLSMSLAAAALLIIRKNLKGTILLLTAMAGDALLVEITKSFFHTSRPPNMLIPKLGYGFPSGHATGSVVFFGILTFLIWRQWNSTKVKVTTSVLYITAISLIGFDRIYLNVHWFSDVMGGYLLGAFWLTLVLFFFYCATNWNPSHHQQLSSSADYQPNNSPTIEKTTLNHTHGSGSDNARSIRTLLNWHGYKRFTHQRHRIRQRFLPEFRSWRNGANDSLPSTNVAGGI